MFLSISEFVTRNSRHASSSTFRRLFFVYAAQFLSCSPRQKCPPPELIPVGSTFNIQNSIPHKSQKTKAVPETNRAKEFQRGTAGVPESTKEGATGLPEGSDIALGAGGREFESRHSDHVGAKSALLRRLFMPEAKNVIRPLPRSEQSAM